VPEPVQVATPSSTHTCSCGGHDDSTPVLDVRQIPHAIRHASVFGAFDAIPAGWSLIIIAPHAPMPLLAQLSERAAIDWEFLVEGPEAWHVRITRLPEDAARA